MMRWCASSWRGSLQGRSLKALGGYPPRLTTRVNKGGWYGQVVRSDFSSLGLFSLI
jgi:hypothetical protein